MRRLHLFEIAEQPWCPRAIRDGLTDYLQWAGDLGRVYDPVAPMLAEALRAAPTVDVVDLCAGGGGPWGSLRPVVEQALGGRPVRVRLTDRFPNHAAFARAELESGGAVRGELRPVDAAHVPPDLVGVRTVFSAFHHFRPAVARGVLADAVAHGQGVAVFEATRRDARALAAMLLAPLLVLVGTPALRPFRWSRLVWTYLVPVIPIVTLWDGLVSCLRTYTPAELLDIAAGLGAEDGWRWQAGEARGRGPIPATYLVGVPPARDAHSDGAGR